jgi:hypothetical protein
VYKRLQLKNLALNCKIISKNIEIDWSEFDNAFGKLYDPGFGKPAKAET